MPQHLKVKKKEIKEVVRQIKQEAHKPARRNHNNQDSRQTKVDKRQNAKINQTARLAKENHKKLQEVDKRLNITGKDQQELRRATGGNHLRGPVFVGEDRAPDCASVPVHAQTIWNSCSAASQGFPSTTVKSLNEFDYVLAVWGPAFSVSRQSGIQTIQSDRLSGFMLTGFNEADMDLQLITRRMLTDKFTSKSFQSVYGGNFGGSQSSVAKGGMVECGQMKMTPIFPVALMQSVFFTGSFDWNNFPTANIGQTGQVTGALSLRDLMLISRQMKSGQTSVTLKGRMVNENLVSYINTTATLQTDAYPAGTPVPTNPYPLGLETVSYCIFNRPAGGLAGQPAGSSPPSWTLATSFKGNCIEIGNTAAPLFYNNLGGECTMDPKQGISKPEVGVYSAMKDFAHGTMLKTASALSGDEDLMHIFKKVKQYGYGKAIDHVASFAASHSAFGRPHAIMSTTVLDPALDSSKYIYTQALLQEFGELVEKAQALKLTLQIGEDPAAPSPNWQNYLQAESQLEFQLTFLTKKFSRGQQTTIDLASQIAVAGPVFKEPNSPVQDPQSDDEVVSDYVEDNASTASRLSKPPPTSGKLQTRRHQ